MLKGKSAPARKEAKRLNAAVQTQVPLSESYKENQSPG